MAADSGPIYAFDDYAFETRTRELRRAGVPIVLTPKVYQVLAYLLEHRNRLGAPGGVAGPGVARHVCG